MIGLYGAFVLGAGLVLAPVAAVWAIFSPRVRRGLLQRLTPLARSTRPGVWVHAASVGEVESIAPLITELIEGGVPVIATTQTTTGRDRLAERRPGLDVRLMPLDFPGLMHWSVRRARVAVLVLVETELWPVAISAVHGHGGRVAIVGARISDRTLGRYRALRGLFGPLLRRVDWIGARSPEDRKRYLAIGARASAADVMGDLKLDRPGDPPRASPALRAAIGPGPLVVAGSTHPGEEEAVLDAWRRLRESCAALRCVLAPRHPERATEVARLVERLGLDVGLRSEGAADRSVVVLDTLGELGALYDLAGLVFVGGSLAPVGGHNLFEPVRAGRVVVHGPHIENQRSQEALLCELGVLHRVADARELGDTFDALWRDPERDAPARAAASLLDAHRGATGRARTAIVALWRGRGA